MSYALRHGPRDYPLPEGRFAIGRAENSDLMLDDPMASRNHAVIVVTGERVIAEDLQSRNGSFVNEVRLTEPRPLQHGDVLRIGSQEFTLIRRAHGRAETLAQKQITHRLQAFGLLGALGEKALAMANGAEAERILGRQLDSFLEQAERREALEPEVFEKVCSFAFRIASLTKKGRWVEFLFRLHAAHAEPMSAEMVNELYALSRKVTGISRAHLRAYVQVLTEKAPTMTPGERFVLNRLEGLEAQLN